MMASTSTILYKFRSGTNFEALPMPGNAARLFDVKRAIVRAKKLDRSGAGGSHLEFDLSVRNANTKEEYTDESMILPRGTRVEVQRVPAPRGHGLLAKIARAETGVGLQQQQQLPIQQALIGSGAASGNGIYDISSREPEEEEEFVNTDNMNQGGEAQEKEDEDELAALMAVTDQARQSAFRGPAGVGGGMNANKVWNSVVGSGGGVVSASLPPSTAAAGRGGHTLQHGGAGRGGFHHPKHTRQADPELREQEQKTQPKKRATGIPRTFLNLNPAASMAENDGSGGGGSDAAVKADGENTTADSSGVTISRLQPNALGFEELIQRGGGQSSTTKSGKRRDLDYALKLTATSIPEHLQCGICHSVVKNAMLLPWDPEGRTACETCIRDALTQSGFRCPLTGNEGVSPDDLLPNHGLRKAADLFVKEVMKKMEEIEGELQREEQEAQEQAASLPDGGKTAGDGTGYEGGSGDKGVVLTRKEAMRQQRHKKQSEDDDLFGGEDEFGGDVFDVVSEEEEREQNGDPDKGTGEDKGDTGKPKSESGVEQQGDSTENRSNNRHDDDVQKGQQHLDHRSNGSDEESKDSRIKNQTSENEQQQLTADVSSEPLSPTMHGVGSATADVAASLLPATSQSRNLRSPVNDGVSNRREMIRKRRPPPGYTMGPAGGASVHAASPALPAPTPPIPPAVQGGMPGVLLPPPPPPPPQMGRGGGRIPPGPGIVGRGPPGPGIVGRGPPAPGLGGRGPQPGPVAGGRSMPQPMHPGRGGRINIHPHQQQTRPPFRGGGSRGGRGGGRFYGGNQPAGQPVVAARGRGGYQYTSQQFPDGGRGFTPRGRGRGRDSRPFHNHHQQQQQQQHVDDHQENRGAEKDPPRGNSPVRTDRKSEKRQRSESGDNFDYDNRSASSRDKKSQKGAEHSHAGESFNDSSTNPSNIQYKHKRREQQHWNERGQQQDQPYDLRHGPPQGPRGRSFRGGYGGFRGRGNWNARGRGGYGRGRY